MSNENRDLIEILLPSTETAIAIASIVNPNLAALSAFLLPFRYYLASCTQIEVEQSRIFMNDLKSRINDLESKSFEYNSFLLSDKGQHLLIKALKAAKTRTGIGKRKLIINLLLENKKDSKDSFRYSVEDYFSILENLSEFEVVILVEAWRLYPLKENVTSEQSDSKTMISVYKWPDLKACFPDLSIQELRAIFIKLTSTGFLIQIQGVWGDDGSNFAFTKIFSEMIEQCNVD